MHQHSHHSRPFIIGIVVVAFFTGGSLAQENTDWKDRFFAEAPKRWENYIRFARTLQVTRKGNRYIGANRSPVGSGHSEYKQTKGAYLSIIYRENGPSKGEAEVEGANPSYSFKLKRRSPDKEWIIMDLEVFDQSPAISDKQRKLQEMRFRATVCDCLILDDHLWLPTLIHDPDFKITAVKPQEINSHPVVRFDFDYPKTRVTYPVRGFERVKGGWMVLDPGHDWILREYAVHHGEPEKYTHWTFQIREGTDGHPIITHRTFQLLRKDDRQLVIGENMGAELEAIERSDVPLEEFTLSAFGLPEPPGLKVERSSQLYLWIALGGVFCLGIGVLIRWRLRRTA